MLYRSEAWCLMESEMGILRRTEISMVRAMCGVQLKHRKRSKQLMLGLNDAIGQLAITNCVHCYGHVLRRALDLKLCGFNCDVMCWSHCWL